MNDQSHSTNEPGESKTSTETGSENLLPPGGVHRVVVVSPSGGGGSYLEKLYATAAGRAVPATLSGFEDQVDEWCDHYLASCSDAGRLVEINAVTAVYWFDQTAERVVVAYGISAPAGPRDVNRIRRFPNVQISAAKQLGDDSFPADRGHFLSHAAGGDLDINLFPQRRELNRGWSEPGKLFRRMEAHAADHPGTFHYHRAFYNDDTWIPVALEYGVLCDDETWWTERFNNK